MRWIPIPLKHSGRKVKSWLKSLSSVQIPDVCQKSDRLVLRINRQLHFGFVALEP